MSNVRDYGYGAAPEIDGVPKVVEKISQECPNCGCEELFLIEVKAKNVKNLKGSDGSGCYFGCPACPWASPMVVTAQAV